jgi:hypothetical protein
MLRSTTELYAYILLRCEVRYSAAGTLYIHLKWYVPMQPILCIYISTVEFQPIQVFVQCPIVKDQLICVANYGRL